MRLVRRFFDVGREMDGEELLLGFQGGPDFFMTLRSFVVEILRGLFSLTAVPPYFVSTTKILRLFSK